MRGEKEREVSQEREAWDKGSTCRTNWLQTMLEQERERMKTCRGVAALRGAATSRSAAGAPASRTRKLWTGSMLPPLAV